MVTKPQLHTEEVSHLQIDADQAGRRIDNLLVSLLGDVPKSHIYRMLRRGEIRINGRRAKPETRVEAADTIRLPPIRRDREPEPQTGRGGGPRGQFLEGLVLHEDEEMLVIDKPAGMAVHGGTGLRYGLIETLRNARGEEHFLELAHRLDRDTSGCLIIAKSMRALRRLHGQLREGRIAKHYLLLARGTWKGPDRTISSSLKKDMRTGGEAVVRVDERAGKHAITHFSLRRQFAGCCLLSADLETGRTHQIRVHASHAGFPLAGDEKYGDEAFNLDMRGAGLRRLFLHAERLEIPLESGAVVKVESPLPVELESVLTALTPISRTSTGPSRNARRKKP
jgi:23S rRNA pseudouridine955/2504/2580 synthase